jgi:hypothetical protein
MPSTNSPHAELPTGVADPPRMKLWQCPMVVGVEVGNFLGACCSPMLSLTVGPWSTPDCRQSARVAVEHAYESTLTRSLAGDA